MPLRRVVIGAVAITRDTRRMNSRLLRRSFVWNFIVMEERHGPQNENKTKVVK